MDFFGGRFGWLDGVGWRSLEGGVAIYIYASTSNGWRVSSWSRWRKKCHKQHTTHTLSMVISKLLIDNDWYIFWLAIELDLSSSHFAELRHLYLLAITKGSKNNKNGSIQNGKIDMTKKNILQRKFQKKKKNNAGRFRPFHPNKKIIGLSESWIPFRRADCSGGEISGFGGGFLDGSPWEW